MSASARVSGTAERRLATFAVSNLAPLGAVLAVAYALKRFYASASASELDWLLAPTTWIVARLSGHAFVEERGAGYLSRELGVLIAPSCAGANYLIVAFVLLAAGFLTRLPGAKSKWGWLALSALFAYAATLAVNATRILLTLAMKSQTLPRFGLSFEQAHRVEGVVVYLSSLWLLYFAAEAVLASSFSRPRRLWTWIALPWLAYLGITLVVPLLNGAARNADFVKHALTVLLVSSVAAALLAFVCSSLRARRAGRFTHTRAARFRLSSRLS
ncbi:MAG TPA: exosortase K [Polyangiaceae bacterium]|nr:exosortase K [Polyangiaceae bacterium]